MYPQMSLPEQFHPIGPERYRGIFDDVTKEISRSGDEGPLEKSCEPGRYSWPGDPQAMVERRIPAKSSLTALS